MENIASFFHVYCMKATLFCMLKTKFRRTEETNTFKLQKLYVGELNVFYSGNILAEASCKHEQTPLCKIIITVKCALIFVPGVKTIS